MIVKCILLFSILINIYLVATASDRKQAEKGDPLSQHIVFTGDCLIMYLAGVIVVFLILGLIGFCPGQQCQSFMNCFCH